MRARSDLLFNTNRQAAAYQVFAGFSRLIFPYERLAWVYMNGSSEV
jgi:hypothetical protein